MRNSRCIAAVSRTTAALAPTATVVGRRIAAISSRRRFILTSKAARFCTSQLRLRQTRRHARANPRVDSNWREKRILFRCISLESRQHNERISGLHLSQYGHTGPSFDATRGFNNVGESKRDFERLFLLQGRKIRSSDWRFQGDVRTRCAQLTFDEFVDAKRPKPHRFRSGFAAKQCHSRWHCRQPARQTDGGDYRQAKGRSVESALRGSL